MDLTLSSTINYFIKLDLIHIQADRIKFNQELLNHNFRLLIKGDKLPNGSDMLPGDYAVKNSSTLNINEPAMLFTVFGDKVKEVIDVLNEVISICSSCGPDIEQNAKFFEFYTEFTVAANEKPAKTISKLMDNSKHANLFKEVFDMDSNVSGFRTSSNHFDLNSTNFFDLMLEPLLTYPNNYFGSIHYRNPDKTKTDNFLLTFEEKIEKLITHMESS